MKYIVVVGLLMTSCSVETGQEVENTDFNKPVDYKLKEIQIPSKDSIKTLSNKELLCKIPLDSFWKNKDLITNYLNEWGDHADTCFLSPYSFQIRDSIIYIPNVQESCVYIYSKKGELINKIDSLPKWSSRFLDILPNGNYLLSGARAYFFEYNPVTKKIKKEIKKRGLIAHHIGNSYYWINDGYIYHSNNMFKPIREVRPSFQPYDIYMYNNKIFQIKRDDHIMGRSNFIEYVYEATGKCTDSFIIDMNKTINNDEYYSLNILGVFNDKLIAVFGGASTMLPILYIQDLKSNYLYDIYYLDLFSSLGGYYCLEMREELPDGICYQWVESEKTIYCMDISTDGYIYIYYFPLP